MVVSFESEVVNVPSFKYIINTISMRTGTPAEIVLSASFGFLLSMLSTIKIARA